MMKHFGLRIRQTSTLAIAVLVAVVLAHPSRSMAQVTASLHGHVNNPINQPIALSRKTKRNSSSKLVGNFGKYACTSG